MVLPQKPVNDDKKYPQNSRWDSLLGSFVFDTFKENLPFSWILARLAASLALCIFQAENLVILLGIIPHMKLSQLLILVQICVFSPECFVIRYNFSFYSIMRTWC